MSRSKQRKQMLREYFDITAKLHSEFGHEDYSEEGLFDEGGVTVAHAEIADYGFSRRTTVTFNYKTGNIWGKGITTTFHRYKNPIDTIIRFQWFPETIIGRIREDYDPQGNLIQKSYDFRTKEGFKGYWVLKKEIR